VAVPESDLFSFGLILYKLIVSPSFFPKDKNAYRAGVAMIQVDWCPDIPNTVIPVTDALIRDCLARDDRHRSSFKNGLQPVEAIEFKLMADVNSVEIESFVTAIENQET
jgi:serine/threonine protein kinase